MTIPWNEYWLFGGTKCPKDGTKWFGTKWSWNEMTGYPLFDPRSFPFCKLYECSPGSVRGCRANSRGRHLFVYTACLMFLSPTQDSLSLSDLTFDFSALLSSTFWAS